MGTKGWIKGTTRVDGKMNNCLQLDSKKLDLDNCEQLNNSNELSIFVIFHDTLYPEMYEDLTEDEFKCFTFVAVNGATSKYYKDKTINEWELPVYFPEWQKNKWMNGGVNHHIVLNRLLKTDYAGFVQYDMKFKKGSVNYIKSLLKPEIGVSMRIMNLENLLATSTYGFGDINLYIKSLAVPMKSKTFPLYHMCIMQSKKWYQIMPDVLVTDKEVFKEMKERDPWYRFPVTTERILALAIGTVVEEVLDVSEYITHERLAGQTKF